MIFDFTTSAQRKLYTFGTCLSFTREDVVEIYLDEIATAAFKSVAKIVQLAGVETIANIVDPRELTTLFISITLVHEWLHHEIGLDESPVAFATEQLQNALIDSDWPRTRPEEAG